MGYYWMRWQIKIAKSSDEAVSLQFILAFTLWTSANRSPRYATGDVPDSFLHQPRGNIVSSASVCSDQLYRTTYSFQY